MSDLAAKAAEARAKMDKDNPSVVPGKEAGARKRIPMSLPRQKLEVPEIPGYHLHWMRGTPQRLQQAHDAGYMFVDQDEVSTNNLSIGGDATKTGNSDMGSRVSIADGSGTDGGGNAIRLYLMKQPMEYYLEDQKLLGQRNDQIAETLTAGYRQGRVGGMESGETAEDAASRYVDPKRSKLPAMFQKKAPRT